MATPLATVEADPTLCEPAGEYADAYAGGCGMRHVMCLLVFMIIAVNYADRSNIGIVIAEKALPDVPKPDDGYVYSAFFVGYIFTQIPGGIIARRWGAKPTLLLAASVWVFFDAMTPNAADLGVWYLFFDRVCMGLGEALVFPTTQAVANFWVPVHERAFLVTFMSSGMSVGGILAGVVSPQLLHSGVALVFRFWACIALLWGLLFSGFAASAPELHKRCLRSGEADWIKRHRGAPDFREASRVREWPVPMRLLRQPSVWAILISHFGVNYSTYVGLSWGPTFFAQKYKLDLASAPVLISAPGLFGMFGGLVAGRVSDWFVARGFRTRHVRKVAQATGACGGALCLGFVVNAPGPEMASFWMSCANFLGACQIAGFWVNMLDICPQSAATLMGLSNTFGTIPGIIGQPITSWILDPPHYNWGQALGVGAIMAVLAAFQFALLGDDVSIDDDLRD